MVSGRTLRVVPVEFLSDERAAAYGRLGGVPGQAEPERFFFLDDADRELTDKRRGDRNRVGFALQMGPVTCRGSREPLPAPSS